MTTASLPAFDPRLLRAPIKTRVFLGRQVVIKRLLASLLTAIVLGLAFWSGAVVRMVTAPHASGLSPSVSDTATRYLLEFVPFLLGAGMLLAFLSWGIGWILPCVFAAAGYLGYVRQDLPRPPKVFTLPSWAKDVIEGFFGWGNSHPLLKLIGLSLLAFVLTSKVLALVADRSWQAVWHNLMRGRGWPFTGRHVHLWAMLSLPRSAIAVPLMLTVQAALLWSLVVMRAGTEGSGRIDQHVVDAVDVRFGAYAPVLIVVTILLSRPWWGGDLTLFHWSLLLAGAVALSDRALPYLPADDPLRFGEAAASATRHLLDTSCWAALGGAAVCLVAIQAAQRLFDWT